MSEFRKCIECFLCQDVCHVLRDHALHPRYFGPRFLVRIASLEMHPLDTLDRHGPRRRTRAASGCATSRSAAPRSAPRTSTSPTTRSSRSRSASSTSATTRCCACSAGVGPPVSTSPRRCCSFHRCARRDTVTALSDRERQGEADHETRQSWRMRWWRGNSRAPAGRGGDPRRAGVDHLARARTRRRGRLAGGWAVRRSRRHRDASELSRSGRRPSSRSPSTGTTSSHSPAPSACSTSAVSSATSKSAPTTLTASPYIARSFGQLTRK